MPVRKLLLNPILWTCVVGIVITIVVFNPGFMTYDAARQLTEARTVRFSDLHPPLMGWLWARLEILGSGPSAMLWLQTLLFWTGLGLCFTTRPRWLAAICVAIIGLLPPVLTGLGIVLKDSLMAAALVLVVGLLLQSQRQQEPRWAFFALLPGFLAMGVRHNAITALLPLMLWWGYLVRPRGAWWSRVAVGGTALAMLYVTTALINQSLVSIHEYASQQFLMHDLVAISLDQNQVLLPQYALDYSPELPPLTIEDMRPMYEVGRTTPIFVIQPPRIRGLPFVREEARYDALIAKWLEVVSRYPRSYLKHRWNVFKAMMGDPRRNVCAPITYSFDPYTETNLGITYTPSAFHRALEPIFTALTNTLLFRAFFYSLVAVALFLLAMPFRLPKRMTVLALTGSALLYTIPLFFTSVSCGFRMTYWSTIATLLAIGVGAVEAYESRRVST